MIKFFAFSRQSSHSKVTEDCIKYKHQLQLNEGDRQSLEQMKNHLQSKVEEYERKVDILEHEKIRLKNNHESECEDKVIFLLSFYL